MTLLENSVQHYCIENLSFNQFKNHFPTTSRTQSVDWQRKTVIAKTFHCKQTHTREQCSHSHHWVHETTNRIRQYTFQIIVLSHFPYMLPWSLHPQVTFLSLTSQKMMPTKIPQCHSNHFKLSLATET